MKPVKRLVLIALLTSIIFIQEEVLSFLPNIQLTVFLFVLYSKKMGVRDTILIAALHVVLDELVMGSMNPLYMLAMFIGWSLIPVLLSTVFKKVDDALGLALCGVVFALIYSWVYIVPNTIVYHMSFINYMKGDILFEVLLAASSFISILWLYNPCGKAFDRLLKKS